MDGYLTISDSSFTGNESNYGAAVYMSGDGLIENTLFTNNSVYTVLSGGESVGGQGGAINYNATASGSSLIISDSVFSYNEAEQVASALAVYALDSTGLSNGTDLLLDSVTIDNNTSAAAAIGTAGGYLTISDSTIYDNSNGDGAAITLYSNTDVELTDTSVFGNTSSEFGAVSLYAGSSLECGSGSSIVDNASGADFAAIGVQGEDSLFISEGCDFGGGIGNSLENTPVDVWTSSDGVDSQVFDYANVQDFECTSE